MNESVFSSAVPLVAIASAIVSALSLVILVFVVRKRSREQKLQELQALLSQFQARTRETQQANEVLSASGLAVGGTSNAEDLLGRVYRMKDLLQKQEDRHGSDTALNEHVLTLIQGFARDDREKISALVRENSLERQRSREIRLAFLKQLNDLEASVLGSGTSSPMIRG